MTNRTGGLLAITASFLALVPLVVLGAAIDWPASLGDPAADALPRLLDNEGAVRFGYLAYLGYSVLLLPVGIAVTRWADGGARATLSTLALIAMGAAAVSSGMRTIGIIRWLSTMFPLAESWEVADDAERAIIAVQFDAVNNYGGAIGELLGVGLFAVVWLAVTALGPGRRHRGGWFVISGAVVAAVVAVPLIDLAGVDPGAAVILSGTAFNLWLLAVGVAMIRDTEPTAAQSTAAEPTAAERIGAESPARTS
ncbi:MAG: DUF4386 family protein [Actinomycetota bacterium]